MFTKFYRCPSCKMTLEAHIITSIRNARPLAERSLRHVHSGSSVHLSSKQYSAVWVVPSLQSLQIHRPVTRRERESQYRAPKPYKESRCRLVKPSPSDQQGLQCIPTSGWHSTRRQASRRPSFMPYRNPICRLSGIPSVGIFSSIHCSCLLMDTRFSETFHIHLLEHVFPGWIPSAKQSTSIENNHSFFITGFQIIFRPPLQRSQAIFFFTCFLHALFWAAHTWALLGAHPLVIRADNTKSKQTSFFICDRSVTSLSARSPHFFLFGISFISHDYAEIGAACAFPILLIADISATCTVTASTS